jgi:Leucine-rich repeat (LRR) protein
MGCNSSAPVSDSGSTADGTKAKGNIKSYDDIINLSKTSGTLNLGSCPADDDHPEGLLLTHGFAALQTIPQKVFLLTSITTLTLKRNEIESVPPAISQMQSLTSLNLSENALSSLPDEIGQLTGLEELDISENQISALPATIGQLTNLKVLSAFKNALNKLPDEIGQCQLLNDVNFFNNKLIRLPATFSGLAALENLNVGGNKLKTLPKTDQWTNLAEFKCHQNTLVMLPTFAGMTALTFLKMDMNRALRELPEFGDGMNALTHLEVNSCDFSALPDSICSMTALETLNCQGNKITQLPALALSKLDILNCSSNKLTSLPESLSQCASLRVFFFQGNSVTNVPASFGGLASLERVMCMDNPLEGAEGVLGTIESTCKNNSGWLKQ